MGEIFSSSLQPHQGHQDWIWQSFFLTRGSGSQSRSCSDVSIGNLETHSKALHLSYSFSILMCSYSAKDQITYSKVFISTLLLLCLHFILPSYIYIFVKSFCYLEWAQSKVHHIMLQCEVLSCLILPLFKFMLIKI